MKDEILILYFDKKMRQVDIAKKFKISKCMVSRIVQKDSRFIIEKEKRKKCNKEKHKQDTKEYIKSQRRKKQFKNNVDDLILRNMHNQASVELSKPRKITNMAYRNWNTSAYSYNEKKKRFEFREELGRSADVPKYIKVEVL